MRIFSFAFHIVLGVAMLAVSSVALLGGVHNLQVAVLPWQGAALTWSLFASGLAGVVLAMLALRRRLAILFVFWTVAVFVMLLRGYFLSSYSFAFRGGFLSAVLLVVGALIAVLGSLLQIRRELKERAAAV